MSKYISVRPSSEELLTDTTATNKNDQDKGNANDLKITAHKTPQILANTLRSIISGRT